MSKITIADLIRRDGREPGGRRPRYPFTVEYVFYVRDPEKVKPITLPEGLEVREDLL